jgi:hypothetical protein
MNNKKILEELAFEKSKRDILKANQSAMDLKKKNIDVIENQDLTLGGQRKYAWEYELEIYRQMRRKERFYIIGAWCGILALVLTVILNHGEILEILMKF